MHRHLVLLLGLALAPLSPACVSSPERQASTAFATRRDAGYAALTEALAEEGWLIQDEAYGFHEDPRGFVGDRYYLERTDSRGYATLFVFTSEEGPGSVLVDVSDEISEGRKWALFDRLRALYDAKPGWRDPGVVFCLDHDPRHIASFEDDAGRETARAKLRAQSGCTRFGWNEPR